MSDITKANCEALVGRIRTAATIEDAGEIMGDSLETVATEAACDAIKATARKCAEIARKLPHHNGSRVANSIYDFYSLAFEKEAIRV